jgi:hypothetical protein
LPRQAEIGSKIQEVIATTKFPESPLPAWQKLSAENGKLSQWSQIAARDAAMTIQHVGNTIKTIETLIQRMPMLSKMIDRKALQGSFSLFRDKHFKNSRKLRNAVAHRAQEIARASRNSIDGPYKDGGFTVEDGATDIYIEGLIGRTITFTHDHEVRSLEVSSNTAQFLREVVVSVFGAFEPATDATLKVAIEKWELARAVATKNGPDTADKT